MDPHGDGRVAGAEGGGDVREVDGGGAEIGAALAGERDGAVDPVGPSPGGAATRGRRGGRKAAEKKCEKKNDLNFGVWLPSLNGIQTRQGGLK